MQPLGSILTSRQTAELHKAIVQYLEPLLEHDRPALERVAGVLDVTSPSGNEPTVARYLEKKWSTVLRLQKKILDLENEVASYKASLQARTEAAGAVTVGTLQNKIDWLPSTASAQFPTLSTQTVNTLAIHPVFPFVVAGCADGALVAWNLAADTAVGPQKQISAHICGVNRIKWSLLPVDLLQLQAEQHVLASCSSDLLIKIWEGDTLTHVRTLTGHEHTVSGLAFSPADASVLYSVSRDKAVKIWDMSTGLCMHSFVGHSDWVRDLDVVLVNVSLALETAKRSSLGGFVLTCSNDQSVRLSHALLGTGLALMLGHTHVVEAVRFLPMRSNSYIDKHILAHPARYADYILDAVVNNPLYGETLGFKYCVSAGRDNAVKLWLLPPPVLVPNRPPQPSQHNNSQGWHVADILGHLSWIRAIDVHPSGRYIFTGSDDKTVRVWDLACLPGLAQPTCVSVLLAHNGFVNCIEMAKFGWPGHVPRADADELAVVETNMRCLFASAGTDNTVKIWS